jgi:hypothetical protein
MRPVRSTPPEGASRPRSLQPTSQARGHSQRYPASDRRDGEPGLGPLHEPGRGLAGLTGVDLGIGQPGVIIDRGVDEPLPVQGVVMAADLSAGAIGLAVAATTGRRLPSCLTSRWTRSPGWGCS